AELEDVRPRARREAAHRRGGHGQLLPQPRRVSDGDVSREYQGAGEGAVLRGDGRVWEAAQAARVAAVDESGAAQDHDGPGGEKRDAAMTCAPSRRLARWALVAVLAFT